MNLKRFIILLISALVALSGLLASIKFITKEMHSTISAHGKAYTLGKLLGPMLMIIISAMVIRTTYKNIMKEKEVKQLMKE